MSLSPMEFWEERFAREEWEWGREPSVAAREIGSKAAGLGLGRVLDVGCGYGRDCMFLTGLGLRPVGVDLTWRALQRAGNWAASKSWPINFVRADLTAWSFKPHTFQALICYNTLHLFSGADRAQIARRFAEALVPGGLMGLAVFSTSEDGYGRGRIVEEGTSIREGRRRHFFTEQELIDLFPAFNCLRLEAITVVDKRGAHSSHIHHEWLMIAEKK